MNETVTAIYEKGVFRPIGNISLKDKEKVELIITSPYRWKKEFKLLLKQIHNRTKRYSAKEIESDITLSRKSIRKHR